jgi:hypothetical protein
MKDKRTFRVALARQQSSHFIETLRDAIDVDKPGDVLVVAEVSKESELAQRAFRERRLCKYTRDHLDRNRLARDLVRSRADDIGSCK